MKPKINFLNYQPKKSFFRGNILVLCIAAILTSVTLHTFSQTGQETDTKAKAILDEISAATKKYASIRVEFEYSVTDKKKNLNEKESGKLFLKGKKYRIEIPGQDITCDEKTVWTYLKDVNEVQISVPQTDDQGINPTSIFTLYEKGFKYQFVKEESKGGTIIQIINLFPLDPGKKPYHTVKLTIDKLKKQISSLEVIGKDGVITTYTIQKFDANQLIDDSKFTFNASDHPGVEVIDLR